MSETREMLDIEAHKKVCRHLYEEISRVFMEKGVVSHDFALAEKLYKKTAPQTIMISRVARNKELLEENKKLRQLVSSAKAFQSVYAEYPDDDEDDEFAADWLKDANKILGVTYA